MFRAYYSAFLAIGTLMLSSADLHGQESAHFAQFYFNPSSLNPSFTGIDGQAAAFLSYRKQWVGIEGSPAVSHFSFQAPNPKRLAIGLNFNQDKRGVIGTSSFLLTTAYNIPLNKQAYMRFGFSLGAGFFRTDIDALKFGSQSTDPILSGLLQNDIQFLGNSGISIHTKTFHFGLAIPHLFRANYLSSTPFSVGSFKPFDQLILHGSYRYYIQKGRFLFEPYVNYRLNAVVPSQLEVATILHLQNLVWFGASYKQDFGISGMAGYKFSPTVALGYAYTIKNTGLNELASPSHEVQLGFLFGTRHRNIPVYSFVNSEKPKFKGRPVNQIAQKKKSPTPIPVAKAKPVVKNTPSKAVVAKPKEAPVNEPVVATQKPLPAKPLQPVVEPVVKKEITVPQKPVVDESQAASRLRQQTQEVPATDERDRPNNLQAGTPRLKEKIDGLDDEEEEGEDASLLHGTNHLTDSLQEVDERERLDRLEEHKQNPMEVHLGEAPHEGRYERVQRGVHSEEMNLGDYVVIGVFKTEANAKKWADGLKSMGFLDIDYGYLTNKSTWYVHFAGTDTMNEAEVLKEKYRKIKLFRDAWVLTVHP